MTLWLEFRLLINSVPPRTTSQWQVLPKNAALDSEPLGMVRWYGPWRKYSFFAKDAVFDCNCLREIADFCEARSKEFWDEKRKAKTAG